jgi:hypothetical protein
MCNGAHKTYRRLGRPQLAWFLPLEPWLREQWLGRLGRSAEVSILFFFVFV